MSVAKNSVPFLNVQPEACFSEALQPFSWPASPDEIADTAFLASCLREGSKGTIDPAQLASYQNLTECVLNRFEKEPSCTLSSLQEIIFLVRARDNQNHYQRVIDKLETHLKHDLNKAALQGWATMICHRARLSGATSASAVAANFKELLTKSHLLLIQPHLEGSSIPLSVLLQTISLLLETMFETGLGEPNAGAFKENLEKTLKAFIDGKEGNRHSDASLAFQAKYALQALRHLRVPKAWWKALWIAAKNFGRGAAYAAWIWFSEESNKFPKVLSRIGAGFKKIKEEWVQYHKERKWYLALCAIDKKIKADSLKEVERFVKAWPSSRKDCLLQGLCFRLERIALLFADEKTKEWALRLLKSLEQGGAEWGKAKDLIEVKLCASAAIERIDYFQHPLNVEQIEGNNDAPPAWHLFWQSQPQSKLLQAVQTDIQQRKHSQLLPGIKDTLMGQAHTLQAIDSKVSALHQCLLPTPSSDWLFQVKTVLTQHYEPTLKIQRISGEELDLEYCYINLAIVESKVWQEVEKAKLQAQSSTFYRPSSYEEIKQTNLQQPIPLEQLLDKRALRNRQVGIPKRILIQGRAGIGKTTLCKKLVYAYQQGLWQDRFDAVLWLPLRQLKTYKAYNLKKLLEEKYFSQHTENGRLAEQLSQRADKILFILDGLDEVATELGQTTSLANFLAHLLKQPQVIVTSRPAGVDSSRLQEFDLELETIGFSQENVQAYLKQVEPEAAADIQALINQIPVIQELANIPVQLDALCYSWDEIKFRLDKQKKAAATEVTTVTMTMLYQAMVDKLWRRDAERLGKAEDGRILSFADLNQISAEEIDDLMIDESDYLNYLSFKGLQDNLIEFNSDYLNETKNELNRLRQQKLSLFLQGELKQTSFLHTADATLAENKRTYHFLHLTFQEFFAAKFLAKHFQAYLTAAGEYKTQTKAVGNRLILALEDLKYFVAQNKYNPRYQIVWWMVAGLLEGEGLEGFFNLLEKEPRDLFRNEHFYLIMYCLREARTRLSQTNIQRMEQELEEELQLEMKLRDGYDWSWLAEQHAFPEHILFKFSKQYSRYRYPIFKALGMHPSLSDKALEILIEALQDKDSRVRRAVADVLNRQSMNSKRIMMALIDKLQDEGLSIRSDAAEILFPYLAKSKKGQVTPLKMLLQHAQPSVRAMAAKVLGFSANAKLSRKALFKLLEDKDPNVRAMAAESLGFYAVNSRQIREILIKILEENKDFVVRITVVKGLRPHAASSRPIREILGRVLEDENPWVKREAARALRPYADSSEQVKKNLMKMLEDEDPVTRAMAIDSLGPYTSSSEQIKKVLMKMLEDEYPVVRAMAAEVLGPYAMSSKEFVDVTTKLLGTEYVDAAYHLLSKCLEQACPILPNLSFDQLQKFYTKFQLHRSYEINMPLYYQDGALHFYTSTGPGEPVPINDEQYKKIAQAFEQARKNILTEFLAEEVTLN